MAFLVPPEASAQEPDDDGFAGSIETKAQDDPEDGLALSIRFAGASRLETAGIIATDTSTARADFDTSTLTVARADVFADALAGSFLGGLENTPLVLSPRDTDVDEGELNRSVRATIAQNGPETITILGGVDAIDTDVEALLAETATVRRSGGVNRFETAALLADLATETDTAIVANGGDFPDALVAGAIAAGEDIPILLTGSDGPLDPFTSERLESLGVENALGLGPHAGLDFVGPSPILLTAGESLSDQTADYFATLSSCDFVGLHVAGGDFAISQAAEDEARDILRPATATTTARLTST